jgi:hypothetical protein
MIDPQTRNGILLLVVFSTATMAPAGRLYDIVPWQGEHRVHTSHDVPQDIARAGI